MRRGRCTCGSLPLNRTSDRDYTTPLPAARRPCCSAILISSLRASAATGVVYALRVQSVSLRAAEGVRPYGCDLRSLSPAALRTARRSGLDYVPDAHTVRYPRVRSYTLHNVARDWRPFLSSTARPKGLASRRGAIFLFGKTKRKIGGRMAQVTSREHAISLENNFYPLPDIGRK